MFKRSRVKIVSIIMAVSVTLMIGMLCIIYVISYKDMYRSHQDMLEHYVKSYDSRMTGGMPGLEPDTFEKRMDNPPKDMSMERPNMRFELSTFYSVKYDKTGTVIGIDNSGGAIYSEEEILSFAEKILQKKEARGIYEKFSYVIRETAEGRIIVFMDNTIETENFGILLKYTLLFAGITLLIIFCLSCFLADKIVKPLEQNAIKQKQFISDAGHELKTPIAVVSTNLEMLKRQTGENKWLRNIEYETEKMSTLIKQLMELAKTEHMLPLMEKIDLSHLVVGEILPFESVAFEQGILLDYERVKPEIAVKGNAEQLKQLISILIDNAIEHSEDKADVIVCLQEQKNKAVFSVANKGTEIPSEQREHLFERFYRGDYSRNGESNHYGLGLAIAKAVTETHKGSIRIACENGYVIFEVQLPLNLRE